MRVSTSYFTQRGLASMLEQQKRLSDIQQQIASGKRLLRPSDDPTGASQILRLEQAVASTAQFQRNSDAALNRLTLEETTLSSVQDSLLRVREIAIQGSNATLGPSDRFALAQEVRERLDELVSFGNTRDANQEYLFSGYQVTTKPFAQAADGTFVYNGDQGQRALQISSGRQIPDSDSGNDVFINIKNGNGTFQINETASNVIVPGSYTAAVSDGNNATPTENTVTAIAGTDGGAGGEQFILTIDGVGAVDVTYGAGETVATPAIAAELDTDLATFIAGSGGAYSIVSGSLSGGDLVLSKADGTPIVFDTSTSTLTGVAASVTESETTSGITANAPTDTAFTMSIDGTQFYTEAAAVGATVTAAELDAALITFVAGSGGAYTIDSGSIATGDLVMSRTDGSTITMTIDSNFSGTVGSFTGDLVSGSNAGTGIFEVGQVVDRTSYVAETYTISFVTNGSNELAYNVFGSVSGQLIPPSPQNSIINAPAYSNGGTIQFNGIQTGISGTPVVGDTFTVEPSTTQDMFSTVQKLVNALEATPETPSDQTDVFNAINQAINEIDIAFDNVLRIRTNVGARLKTIEDQTHVNESFKIEMIATLSSVRDLDIAEAAVELQSRLIALEAAQTTYTRIQGLSLFEFI
jgi:flagellar hook-associated protein 3 FlgL